MEGVKVNGETAPANQNGPADTNSSGQKGAKSVISINNDKVTIVSTGKDGKSRGSKVTTTPLRTSPTPGLTGTAHVSTKVRDTQFVTALSQQFQASNGTLMAPPVGGSRSVPSSSTSSSRASHSRSSSSSSSTTEDLTSKLSSMLLLQQQQQQQLQQQQQRQQQQQPQQQQQEAQQNVSTAEEGRQQEVPESSSSSVSSCPSSSSSTSSSSTSSSSTSTAPVLPNGTPNGRDSGASSPEMPPPPPPSALLRSVSEQPALRKVDASYTPRPKSYSTQNSVTPGNGNPPVHNKNDLMAALSVAVNSGSAVAGLRKTRGPGRSGGVTEVVIPKKKSGTSSASRREEN